MFPNRYSGHCNNAACKIKVEANEGFTEKLKDRYVVWCRDCVPQKIESPKQVRKITAEGKIYMPFERENLDLLRSFPGARFDRENKHWEVSLDAGDRTRVLELAQRLQLEIDPELRALSLSDEAKAAANAGLYPYQVEGVNFLASKPKALLGDEMGLGKSVQSLMGIPLKNGKALVICRAGLKYNWLDEVRKWRTDLTPVVLNGRNSFRWPKSGEVVIINSEILPDDFNAPKKNSGEKLDDYWDRLKIFRDNLKLQNAEAEGVHLIVDEAHDYKNRDAAKSRKVKEFARLASKLTGLTGSPLTNRPEDLFGVLDVLGLAKEVFGTWERFQSLFNVEIEAIRTRTRYINKIIWGKPKPIVPELLRRVMLRRRRSEVLPDLPAKTYTNFVVGGECKPQLKAKLDAMWEAWGTVLELDGELPPFERFSDLRQQLAQSRVEAMLDYVENAEEQEVPLVVFSSHLAPLDALLGRPGWGVITGQTSPEKRQEIVRAFQAGLLKGVGVSIRAGGVGINLTHAWKALFVDLDWSPAANWQAEDRIARIGQKSNKVEIIRMVSDHPLDLHVQKLLIDKIDTIVKAIDGAIEVSAEAVKPNVEETDEQYEARMKKLNDKLDAHNAKQNAANETNKKALAKSKVSRIYTREQQKLHGSGRVVLELTEKRISAVRHAFKHMLSVCDGASKLDNVGFNKPDAIVAHWLLTAGLETLEEVEAGYMILSRYHRQLKDKYSILFNREVSEWNDSRDPRLVVG